MCDYSLHMNRTRLAEEGEQLVTYRFPGGSIGLASPAELSPRRPRSEPHPNRPWFFSWRTIVDWFQRQSVEVPCVTAVCVPPGARLVLRDIAPPIQRQMEVSAEEIVTFDQLSADTYSYRDCVRFTNSRRLLLQRLHPGQRVEVLSLMPEPAETLDETRYAATLRPSAVA